MNITLRVLLKILQEQREVIRCLCEVCVECLIVKEAAYSTIRLVKLRKQSVELLDTLCKLCACLLLVERCCEVADIGNDAVNLLAIILESTCERVEICDNIRLLNICKYTIKVCNCCREK